MSESVIMHSSRVLADEKGVHEMVRRCNPPPRRSMDAAVSEEDYRHADSFDWHRPG